MNYLKKIVLVSLFSSLGLVSFSQDQPFESGENPGLLPSLKSGFHPQVSIAPQVAYISFGDSNSSGIAYGIEAALQCPLLCTKKNYIRQQISALFYTDGDFKYMNITLNPEYRFYVTADFELAAGPSLGISNSKVAYNSDIVEDYSKTSFTYGLSTSATRHFGKMFVGVSARYLLTPSDKVGIVDVNYNNFQAILKLGYKL